MAVQTLGVSFQFLKPSCEKLCSTQNETKSETRMTAQPYFDKAKNMAEFKLLQTVLKAKIRGYEIRTVLKIRRLLLLLLRNLLHLFLFHLSSSSLTSSRRHCLFQITD